jgi:hypothetical protein
MRNKLILFLLILLLPLSWSVYGQKQVNSPFSRFNIGSIEPAGSFKSQAMGGLSISLKDNATLFYTNPASYSSLDTNSFVFDFGLDYSMNRLSDGTTSYTSDDMNFDHLIMGFPLSKKWGMSLGVVPFSNGYYRMTESVEDAGSGNYTSAHAGNGGLSSLFLGTGLQVFKNFAAGVNMTVLFGQLKRNNDFYFDDIYNAFNNSSSESLQLTGINLDYGVQYTIPLKKNYFINAGASFTPGKYYKSNYVNFVYRYTAFGTSDTISYTANESGSVFIPGSFRAGVSFGKINKFTAGLDFVSTRWSKSTIPGSASYIADTKMFMFGLEYTPDKFSNFGLIRRIDYRIGAHTGDNYLVIGGKQVKEAGISAGFGLPLRTYSKANFFVDFTRKTGSATGGIRTEDYITFGASINLYDFWFVKHKYD